MNCKGNQLARIVVSPGQHGYEHHGKIVFITTLYSPDAWNYEGDLFKEGSVQPYRYPSIYDHSLRPIDNPDEDAVDETLTWKCGKPPKVDVDAVKRAKQKEKADV